MESESFYRFFPENVNRKTYTDNRMTELTGRWMGSLGEGLINMLCHQCGSIKYCLCLPICLSVCFCVSCP